MSSTNFFPSFVRDFIACYDHNLVVPVISQIDFFFASISVWQINLHLILYIIFCFFFLSFFFYPMAVISNHSLDLNSSVLHGQSYHEHVKIFIFSPWRAKGAIQREPVWRAFWTQILEPSFPSCFCVCAYRAVTHTSLSNLHISWRTECVFTYAHTIGASLVAMLSGQKFLIISSSKKSSSNAHL